MQEDVGVAEAVGGVGQCPPSRHPGGGRHDGSIARGALGVAAVVVGDVNLRLALRHLALESDLGACDALAAEGLHDVIGQRVGLDADRRTRIGLGKEADPVPVHEPAFDLGGIAPRQDQCGFGFGERLFAFLIDKPIRETQMFPLVKPKESN